VLEKPINVPLTANLTVSVGRKAHRLESACLRKESVREETRRLVMVLGAAVALVGAFLVAASIAAELEPYSPPPGCEVTACPSHPEFGFIWAEDLLPIGVVVVISGLAIVLAATLAIELPLTREEEQVILEKLERVSRRFD
jgi:hypothetical protein